MIPSDSYFGQVSGVESTDQADNRACWSVLGEQLQLEQVTCAIDPIASANLRLHSNALQETCFINPCTAVAPTSRGRPPMSRGRHGVPSGPQETSKELLEDELASIEFAETSQARPQRVQRATGGLRGAPSWIEFAEASRARPPPPLAGFRPGIKSYFS